MKTDNTAYKYADGRVRAVLPGAPDPEGPDPVSPRTGLVPRHRGQHSVKSDRQDREGSSGSSATGSRTGSSVTGNGVLA